MDNTERNLKSFLSVNITRIMVISAFLTAYDAYLAFDNFKKDSETVGTLAAFCAVMTFISLTIIVICRLKKVSTQLYIHVAIMMECVVYWATYSIFLYSGGTGGTSIFLIFTAVPVAFYFYNMFYGMLFCGVFFIGMAVYMWTPLRFIGYQYPELYYERLPIMFLAELVVCAMGQYETVKAKNEQDDALDQAKAANEAKTDFLANTSHEIRTPMNSILGFCELALREDDLSPTARDYCLGIQSSGRNLLYIINDILDISKIEAGKLEIVEENFEPETLIADVVNIAMARKKDKDLEVIVNVDGNCPKKLYGDMGRIRQIVINLVTNAIKYTPEGGVYVDVHVEGGEDSLLTVRVEDTGIGIKPKDLEKIFESFQQVDTKRNRSIEGTGLGLAISKRLADLMGGDIKVESEYGRGSSFTLHVPVGIVSNEPVIERNDFPEARPAICTDTRDLDGRVQEFYDRAIDSLCQHVGMKKLPVPINKEIRPEWEDLTHIFVDTSLYGEYADFFDNLPSKPEVIVISDVYSEQSAPAGKRVIYKPVYTMTLASFLSKKAAGAARVKKKKAGERFKAPDAKILLVDDNPINLRVESRLMEGYGMTIATASSGFKALDILDSEPFDIIFMDHMMPEMDGIETLEKFRERGGECNANTPFIVLTANAVQGVKQMFIDHGFQDYLSKPMDMGELDRLLERYLPEGKILWVDKS